MRVRNKSKSESNRYIDLDLEFEKKTTQISSQRFHSLINLVIYYNVTPTNSCTFLKTFNKINHFFFKNYTVHNKITSVLRHTKLHKIHNYKKLFSTFLSQQTSHVNGKMNNTRKNFTSMTTNSSIAFYHLRSYKVAE